MSKKFHEVNNDNYEHRSENADGKPIYFNSAVSQMTEQQFENLTGDQAVEKASQNVMTNDRVIDLDIIRRGG